MPLVLLCRMHLVCSTFNGVWLFFTQYRMPKSSQQLPMHSRTCLLSLWKQARAKRRLLLGVKRVSKYARTAWSRCGRCSSNYEDLSVEIVEHLICTDHKHEALSVLRQLQQISRANAILKRIKGESSTQLALQSSISQYSSAKGFETVNTNISELLSAVKADNCEGKIFALTATITKMRSNSSWSYLSCQICKTGAKFEGSQYMCGRCHTTIDHPVRRYRLSIDIFDGTMGMTIIAFDREAEALLGQNVDDMYAISKKENGPEKVEKIFDKLIGIDAKFEFRPSTYDITHKSDLTARKICKILPRTAASSILSQCTPPSQQSFTLDNETSEKSQPIPAAVDKGKQVLIHVVKDENVSTPTSKGSQNILSVSTRKGGKRGIVINDVKDSTDSSPPAPAKSEQKRRKKEI